MNKVQRAVVGGYVKADLEGRGIMTVGRIVDIDAAKGKVSIELADGTEAADIPRSEIYKATEKEFNHAKKNASVASEQPESTKTTTQAPKAKEEAPKAKEEALRAVRVSASVTEDNDSEAIRASKMAAALQRARQRYVKDKLPNGRVTAHCGDTVAIELHGMSLEETKKYVAAKIGTSAAALTKKYGHLNRGQQRMLLGLMYRKFLRAQGAGV